MSEISFKLLTPTVPNFIMFDAGQVVQKQDGFNERLKIAVGDLSSGQLEVVAEMWKKALFENAERQRANKGQP